VALTDQDLPLKLQVTATFRCLGYTAFAEVDLCTYTYKGTYRRKQITDFDVLGVRLEPDLGSQVAVAECKSVEERAMENLLKLNGVKEFFGANKAYFVQQRIDENAREVGADLGIMCLDAENLISLMTSLGIDAKDIEVESRVYAARCRLADKQKADFQRCADYLKYDFWTLPDHRNIINLVRLLEQIAEQIDKSNLAHIILIHQLVTAFSLATLRVTGRVVSRNIDDLPGGLLTTLLGGSRERRDRETLHDMVTRIVPDGGFSVVPSYFPQLAELAQRYANAMRDSHRVVQCLDDMTRHVLLPDLRNRVPALSSIYSDRAIKLARDTIHFVVETTKVPKDVFTASLCD
jgi:hypothetical protein